MDNETTQERPPEYGAATGSADLLPCPFCGRASPGPKRGVYMIAVAGGTAVRCPTCNAHGPACPTFEQAMAQWQQRTTNTKVEFQEGSAAE
jgi:Lar family restriction alleviation protein